MYCGHTVIRIHVESAKPGPISEDLVLPENHILQAIYAIVCIKILFQPKSSQTNVDTNMRIFDGKR